ncbi:MAG: cellulose binding domain-containing protein [Sulfurovum sp.]|nr:cellulose binding domain-containing protein [Sulfurovum sp.]
MFILKIMTITLLLFKSTSLLGVDVTLNITKDWGSGFCAKVILYNPTAQKVDWTVSFNAKGIISTFWNGNYTQDSDTLTTIATGLDWNNVIKPYDDVSFGYCADATSAKAGELIVIQTQTDKWDDGFCNKVEVKNLKDYKLIWTVDFPVEGSIFTVTPIITPPTPKKS